MTRWFRDVLERHSGPAKALTGVGASQAVLQAINLLAGFVVVRWLDPVEYAYYTIVGGVMGFLSIITDSGMNSGAYAIGGKIWQDRRQLGHLVATFSSLRRRFTAYAMLVAIPVQVGLLARNGAAPLVIAGLCFASALQFWVALPAMTNGLAPALHQRLFETQRISIVQATLRLACIVGSVSAWPHAIWAVVSAVPSNWYANRKLRTLSSQLLDRGEPNSAHRDELLKTVRKVLPGALYYAVSGQITVLLVSIFGSTGTLAEVGALGRLGQLVAVLAAVSTVLFAPRFARMNGSASRLIKTYLSILLALGGVAAGVCILGLFFPQPFLWLLGQHYTELSGEVFLQFIAASMGLLAGTSYQLGAVRGRIYSPYIAIPCALLYQVIGVMAFDFTTVVGVLMFSVGLSFLQFFQNAAYFVGSTLYHERKQ